jgi:hypothetical protein
VRAAAGRGGRRRGQRGVRAGRRGRGPDGLVADIAPINISYRRLHSGLPGSRDRRVKNHP